MFGVQDGKACRIIGFIYIYIIDVEFCFENKCIELIDEWK